jgi:membrane protease YdiL (CAAX protease family)
MKKIHITLPLALITLAVWLGVTLGASQLQAGGIGLSWLLAALFALLVSLAGNERRTSGLHAPTPSRSWWLVSPPLLYSLLMLAVAWAGGWPAPKALLLVAGNAALVALSEELMFRAILLQGLLDRYAIWPAVLLSSALFGVVHTANGLATGDLGGALWQATAAFLQGIVYAAIRLRTRSVWPMMVVHGVWDFALVSSIQGATAGDEASILPYAALVAVLPLCLYGVYLLRGSQRALLQQEFQLNDVKGQDHEDRNIQHTPL